MDRDCAEIRYYSRRNFKWFTARLRSDSPNVDRFYQHSKGERVMFSGIQFLSVVDLGVSQLYLSEEKISRVQNWFDPNDLSSFDPLTVYDFGDRRLTLTDGHSRAFWAYKMGVKSVPCICDSDAMVTSELGQLLYKNDLVWCERFHICSVIDLEKRIVPASLYNELWISRCDKAYNLLTKTTEAERQVLCALRPDLYLFGANEDMSMLYFENKTGESFTVPI